MRVLIAYYSKTGNTETISNAIREALEAICEVDVLKIKMMKEYSNRLLHLNPRVLLDVLFNRKPKIGSLGDMSPYDVVCVGTPNWYGKTAPPMNTFLWEMANTEGKRAIAFVSSELGRESYVNDLKKRLEEKNLKVLKILNLVARNINKSQLNEIREILIRT